MSKKDLLESLKNNFSLIVILFLGTFLWSLTIVKSGLEYPFGLGFWGANGHDGVWHIALAKSLARGSWEMPTFAGETLKNYHIGFDLLLVFVSKLTTIPIETLYFQIFPPVFAFLVGLVVYKFVYSWKGKKEALLTVFFTYFGGSWAWILGKGESAFWAQQSISTLINPPFALSLVFLFLGLTSLLKNKKLLAIVFFGLLIQIKVYAGILALGALFVSGLYEFTKGKKTDLLIVFGGSLILSVLLFLPLNKFSGSLLVFKPFWFLETMLGLSDRFYWPRLYEAIMNYKLGGVWYKLISAYLVAFAIFKIGNFGTRVIGLKYFFQKLRDINNINWSDVFIVTIIAAGIVMPMFFLQSGTPWNTIQFLYYSLIFSGILAGITVSKMSKFVIFLVILLTIPTTIVTLKNDYLPDRPPAMISIKEVEALDFLESQKSGTVLTYPFDEFKARGAVNNPPRPLYFYESTAYVAAFANKPVYLEDQVNLDITGYDWKVRREKVEWFIKNTDEKEGRKFLKENNIKYIYLVKNLSPLPGEMLKLGTAQLGLKQVFENAEVVVFEVQLNI